MKRPLAFLCCLTLSLGTALGTLVGTAARADAAPLPAAYGGSAVGDVANVGIPALSTGVRLANANAAVNSQSSPRSSATSRNLASTVVGFGVGLQQVTQTAPPDHESGTGQTALGADINLLGISASALKGNDHARWSGDASCFSGDLADSSSSTAGLSVTPVATNVLTTADASTRGTTGLVTTSGLNKAVRSQVTGSVAGVSVLGTLAVSISGPSSLSVTADGSTGAVTPAYTPGVISYKLGTAAPVTITAPTTVTVGLASVVLTPNQPTTSGDGRSVTSSLAGVLSIRVGTTSVDLLPMTVSANAPAGGIDCTPDAPTLTTPVNASLTNDATPTFTGTGRPGASVNLTLDSGAARTGVATVDGSGNWSYTPSADIADGSHTASVTQTVNGATSAASNANTFTIDTAAPAAPTLSRPADNSLVGSARPTFSGTAEANSTVRVFVDGASIGTTGADSSGAFSLAAPSDLADGSHTAYVRASDAAQNTSANSNTNSFRIDATAPAAPVVTTPADGSSTRDTTPLIAGTAEAGAAVTVVLDGTALPGTVTADSSGAWRLTSTALTEGSHTVRARATDAAGNVSANSATNTFRVDRTAPSAPVISEPADGSRTADSTPTVTGTGEAGATVSVSIDGTVVGTAAVGSGNSWSLTPGTALNDGQHAVSASQADTAGNVSASASNTFVVDTTAPTAPVITGPPANSVHRGPDVTIGGTGEPGARLVVTDSVGGALGAVTVGAGGTWSVQDTSLADGSHTVSAVQTDAVGNASSVSNSVTFTVASTAPAAPVITAPANNSSTTNHAVTIGGTGVVGDQVTVTDGTSPVGAAVTVGSGGTWSLTATLPDGRYTVSATQKDGADNVSATSNSVTFTVDTTAPANPVISRPADNAVITDTTPTITGTGEPGALVTVGVDSQAIGTTRVAGDGSWSLPTTAALSESSHTVTAVQTDVAGNASGQATSSFTIDATAPAAPVITAPTDGAVIATATPDVTGTGTAGDRIEVSVDGGAALTTTVAGNGSWSVTSATLTEGAHQAAAVEIDAAGNRSTAADVGFRVDLTRPAAPVVQRPADGTRTNNTTPTLSGTAEPNSTVLISLNGTQVATTTASGSGSWFVVSAALAAGDYNLTAVARDAAGNVSDVSNSHSFTVDLTAPGAPVISAPANGALITERTPTISGTGETGARLSVRLDGQALGTTTVNAGAWSVPVTDPLSQGTHTVTATQTDAAGNTSGSVTSTFTVDSVAPSAPVIIAPSQNATVSGPDVTVAGSGEPGAQLVLTVDQTAQPPVTVGQDGGWSVVLTGLGDGAKAATAVQTDVAGNVSPASPERDFTVASAAPAAPVITAPTEGAVTADTTPTVTGTGVNAASVDVSIDGQSIGTATVSGGTWSLTPTAPLGQGGHVATAVQTVAGTTSAESTAVNFRVDSVAPAKPVITSPQNGFRTNDTTPTIVGTGEAGATLTVFDGTTSLGQTTVGTDSSWTLTPTAGLDPGDHVLTARQSDVAGNASVASDPVTVTVDITAPAEPVINTPTEGATLRGPNVTVTGTGEAGATLVLRVNGTDQPAVIVGQDGNWSVALTGLADGPYAATAIQTDVAGNVSDRSITRAFTLSSAVPAAPAITSPRDGAVLGDNTPVITGSGVSGATITVRVDGTSIGTTSVSGGTWTLTPTIGLADGQRVITASQTVSGLTSANSNAVSVTIDTRAPNAPVIIAPTESSTVTGPDVTVTGTGEPGARLVLTVNDEAQPAVTVASNGSWSVPLTLAPDVYTATAVQTDAAGNGSQPSAPRTFGVTPVAPAAPVITSPDTGDVLSDRTPTVTGSGASGATVTLYADGVAAGTATVSNGAWSIDDTILLADGAHTFTATQTVEGRLSAESSPVTVTIDGTAPQRPVINTPADGADLTDNTPTITGSGEPAAALTVYVDGGSVGTVTVNDAGSWTLTPTSPIDDGDHVITARQTDAAQNISPVSEEVAITIDTRRPDTPVIASPGNGTRVAGPNVTVVGTGEPGARLVLRINGTDQPVVTVGQDSRWTVDLTGVADGTYDATAVQEDAAGNVSDRSETDTFTVAPNPPDAPVIASPTDGALLADNTPTISGSGTNGATVTVRVDNVVLGTTTVANGSWTFTPSAPLGDGVRVATATQSVGGVVSAQSEPVSFTIDVTAPAKPVITAPVDGAVTNNRTPVINGTGEAGATVSVIIDGTPVGTALVGSNGTWTYTPTTPLNNGNRVITAKQTDPAGNTSPTSDRVTVTVDTTAPNAPVITAPTSGSTVIGPGVIFTGTGEPGARLVLSVDGVAQTAVTVAQNGQWSVPVSSLTAGNHTATAVQTDPAGNPSSRSTPDTVTVRLIANPRISAPANGSTLVTPRPTISGTGEPGGTINVTIIAGPSRGDSLGTVTVKSNGTWSLVADQNLVPGSYTFGATQKVTGAADRASNQVSVKVTTTVPGAPTSLKVKPGDRKLDLSFVIPTSTGGKPITGYQVSLDGGKHWSTLKPKSGTPLTATVVPVLNGATFQVQVRAVNANGAGRSTPIVVAKTAAWFSDPVSKSDRAKEVAVPKNPSSYKGKLTHTKATNKSNNGTIAYPADKLKGRQLQPKQAVELGGTALFPFDSSKLTSKGKAAVKAVAASLHYTTAVTCEGYADYGGSSSHENALATARAKVVCAELKKDAKQLTSLKVIGYGSSLPAVIGGKASDRSANRRTVILVRQ